MFVLGELPGILFCFARAKLLNHNLAQGYYVKPGDRVIAFSQSPDVLADVHPRA
jgi:hypothetical protein